MIELVLFFGDSSECLACKDWSTGSPENLVTIVQVVYFKPAHIVKNNMNKFVDLKYRIAFQSAANEGILHLMKMASEKVGYHVENSTQVYCQSFSVCPCRKGYASKS